MSLPSPKEIFSNNSGTVFTRNNRLICAFSCTLSRKAKLKIHAQSVVGGGSEQMKQEGLFLPKHDFWCCILPGEAGLIRKRKLIARNSLFFVLCHTNQRTNCWVQQPAPSTDRRHGNAVFTLGTEFCV